MLRVEMPVSGVAGRRLGRTAMLAGLRVGLVWVATTVLASSAWAQVPDLAYATLEELMDIEVTSAARTGKRAEDTPAAAYVITRQEIRSSGLVSLPEILRLAPGVQVSRVNASRWAVSIRGFVDAYANKLLVLVDGRSVYSRTISGVFWDMLDVPIDSIERIEVIRGPGGVAWGANAVNGIVNIITRSATETQGGAVDVGAGGFGEARARIRYGGRLNQAFYRVFSQWSRYGDSEPDSQLTPSDRWHMLTNGGRIDWSRGPNDLLVQGHHTVSRSRAIALQLTSFEPGAPTFTDGVTSRHEVSLLSRLTHRSATGSVLQAQVFHTHTEWSDAVAQWVERTTDLHVQHEARINGRHRLLAGGGYRHVGFESDDTLTVQLGSTGINTLNAFLQDEIALQERLALTVGAKLEYDSFDEVNLMPSARVMWEASPQQRLWAAVSKTYRTPSLTDRDFRINFGVEAGPGFPMVFGLEGNPEYRHETFVQAEAGHRVRIGEAVTLDTTVYTGSYTNLATIEPMEPEVRLTPSPHLAVGTTIANLRRARAQGVEINARWHPLARWQLEGSYGFFSLRNTIDPASLDPNATRDDGNTPRHQWSVRSSVSPRQGIQLSVLAYHSGRLRRLQVPAYTRLDSTLEVRLHRRLSALVALQNLNSGRHQEFVDTFGTVSIPRKARVDLRWEF